MAWSIVSLLHSREPGPAADKHRPEPTGLHSPRLCRAHHITILAAARVAPVAGILKYTPPNRGTLVFCASDRPIQREFSGHSTESGTNGEDEQKGSRGTERTTSSRVWHEAQRQIARGSRDMPLGRVSATRRHYREPRPKGSTGGSGYTTLVFRVPRTCVVGSGVGWGSGAEASVRCWLG